MEFIVKPTIGSDVEFFVRDSKEIVSAEGFIPGTKQKPELFVPGNKFFATQLDNVLAEGNIPPAANWQYFVQHMDRLRSHMEGLLKPHGLHTVAQAAAHIPEKYLQTENARTFGCDASFNCWTLKEEPVTPNDATLRSAGFHIHIGYNDPRDEVNIALVRLLDFRLGLAAMLDEPKSDRHKMGYGLAGNFRHQKHGVEYRTLSSYYASHPTFIRWVFDACITAVNQLNGDRVISTIKELTAAADDIQGCINTDDKKAGLALNNKLLALIGYSVNGPAYYKACYTNRDSYSYGTYTKAEYPKPTFNWDKAAA